MVYYLMPRDDELFGGARLFHGHGDLELLLQLLNRLMVFVLLFLQCLDLSVAPFDLLVDELHPFAHVLATLLQFLTNQNRPIQLEDLQSTETDTLRLCSSSNMTFHPAFSPPLPGFSESPSTILGLGYQK